MEKVKSVVLALWSNDSVRRFVHTFWQAFVAVFAAGLLNVLSAFQGGLSGGKSTLVALITAAIAAGLSALKSAYVNRV